MSDEFDVTITSGYFTPGRRLNNWAGSTAPVDTDDESSGYGVGSMWLDTVNRQVYFCADATTVAAVWVSLTASLTASGALGTSTAPATSSFAGTSV